MCGIGGMLGRPDEAVLHRINRLQRHRGPDGDGVWADERVGLAHTSLAILDLDGGQQPIVGQHGAVAVVNGEIYNHLDLRAACSVPLSAQGGQRGRAGTSCAGGCSWRDVSDRSCCVDSRS